MASISTCFTITPKYHAKPFIYSLRPHNDVFHKEYLKFGRHHSGSNSKSLPSEIRASFNVPPVDATARVRPGKIIESDKLPTDVRKRVMDAVDMCGRRVTVGDVASKAGIKLTEAQRALQAIAADTNGFLEVSDEGDVLYVFPKDFRSKLGAKSLRIKTEPYLEKAKSGAEYLIRVTFGTALIASIVIVYTTIIAILTSSSEEDNRGRRRGRSFDSGFSFYLSPTDLFWYWDPYYYRRRRVRSEDNGMNFIESVFSFVFGDGDPNEGIEEERWKLICQYIASNGGVVTAEELAPYLDVETAETTMRLLLGHMNITKQYNLMMTTRTYYLFFCVLTVNQKWMKRGTSSIGFHHFNTQLLQKEVVGRNMWGEHLVNGLEDLTSFSRKENGISVKLATQRGQWLLVWAGLISLG